MDIYIYVLNHRKKAADVVGNWYNKNNIWTKLVQGQLWRLEW